MARMRSPLRWEILLEYLQYRYGYVRLPGYDLRGVNWVLFDLTNADLRDADLSDADLRHTSLINADLRGAVLRNTDLREADLYNADMTNCYDEEAIYD